MNILVIGGGAREHAVCWGIKHSPLCKELYCAPGNYGIGQVAELIPIKPDQVREIVAFARENKIDLVVAGPELPLVLGLADELEKAGIPCFGPSRAAAQLEASKGFMKDLCKANNIPTAAYTRTNNLDEVKKAVAGMDGKIVVKADGLAAGKGVIICANQDEAVAAAQQLFNDKSIDCTSIVIEEFLEGEEASFFALICGNDVVALAAAQDHKQVFDGDRGPNTGGMGAYSPAPVVTQQVQDDIMNKIIKPTAAALVKAGTPYSGVIFAGLMITPKGPYLIEYNVRFGDPECQALVPRLKTDLLSILFATAKNRISDLKIEWKNITTVGVVMASEGYPGDYKKGTEIKGLSAIHDSHVQIFHAATREEDGRILAEGGRVLSVVGIGANVTEAQTRAYQAIGKINWPQGFFRKDIGWRAIAREQKVA
jgi:phosphoribosylamine--glycine ligase